MKFKTDKSSLFLFLYVAILCMVVGVLMIKNDLVAVGIQQNTFCIRFWKTSTHLDEFNFFLCRLSQSIPFQQNQAVF